LSFLTWAALAVAGLVVAPLLAHLLRRRPPDEEPFAAIKFVPATAAVAQRRTALEDRALLAIRMLVVLALAVLGATPFVSCSRLSLTREGGASVALAIVLDDSMSMRAELEPGDRVTRFARAKEAAAELLVGLQDGDAVAIVLAGDPVRVALAASTNLDAARGVIDKVTVSDRGTDIDGSVSIAAELLGDLEHVDKRVVVLSDLAGGAAPASAADSPASESSAPESSSTGELQVPAGVKLWVPLDELRGARRNCGVVHADRNERRVAVRVACGPGPTAEDAAEPQALKIVVRAGEKELVSSPLRLPEGVADLVLKIPEDQPLEDHIRLQVALSGPPDAIPADDMAPVVSIGGRLRVGVVSDPASSHLATGGPPAVEQAFNAMALGVQLRPLSAVPDRAEELDTLGLLICDDMPGFTPSQRRELTRWIDNGGVLLITLGPGAAAAPLGSSFAPMVPAIVRWSKDAPAGLDPDSSGLFGEALEGMDELEAKGRATLDLETAGVPIITAKWSDGSPFALEKRMGRGVVYAITLPFDTEVSDLALRPAFLFMLERLTVTARTLGGVARTTVGTPWTIEGFDRVSVSHLDKHDKTTALEVQKVGRTRRLTPEYLGLYELTLDDNVTSRVAAISAREVDLRPRPTVESHDSGQLGGVDASVDISAHIAVILLALLFGELLLRVLSPRVRPRGEGGPVSSRRASS
jgi:hypothetical protein